MIMDVFINDTNAAPYGLPASSTVADAGQNPFFNMLSRQLKLAANILQLGLRACRAARGGARNILRNVSTMRRAPGARLESP